MTLARAAHLSDACYGFAVDGIKLVPVSSIFTELLVHTVQYLREFNASLIMPTSTRVPLIFVSIYLS